MSWQMKFVRYSNNDVEIAAHVDYFDSDKPDETLHHEEATFPASTPLREIREEFGRRGRSERARQGRNRPGVELLGEVTPIDDL